MDQISGAPPVLKGPDSKKYTQLLFTPSATPELIPKRFKMPYVLKYDGTSDPQEHITTYTTVMKGNDLAPHDIESFLLKKFGETLTNGALTWYSLLPEHSIDSFEMLADPFIKAHAGARKAKGWDQEKNKEKSKNDFNKDRRSSRGRFFPYERAVGHGRGFQSVDKFAADRRTDRGQNNRSLQDKETTGSRDFSYPRLSKYNFNVSIVELVLAMRNIKEARFLKPIRSDPNQRDPNLGCKYHGTNGHRTGDCRHLYDEVAILLKNDHLGECLSDLAKNIYGHGCDNAEPSKAGDDPPCLTINIILGGNEINDVTFSAAKKTKVLVTHSKRLREVAEENITFTEEDADGLLLLHNYALVISLNVLNFKIKRVPVDPGSSANIIQWRVLEQAKLTESIIPAMKLLAGFNMASVTTLREILLPTNTEGVMKTTLFEVVDGDMGYNIIPGRPWLHETKVVPSTYHQLLKFPTNKGIKQIRSGQPKAREMNAISVSSSKGKEHEA
ncbi:uncharacterized protein [Nicotiana tomentosiformis]|uniref:uncharacterized protein n=1 Tax=Nicotiana tomentosiformis TaxID=4098 RepID=UPI00388CA00B